MWFDYSPDIVGYVFDEEGQTLTITFREKSNIILTSYPSQPAPDRVWKEVYGVVEGKLVKIKEIKGTHIPSHTIKEQFVFDQ